MQKRLCDAIAGGNYYQAACAYARVGFSTFRHWMILGKQMQSGRYREFREAVLKAQADAEVSVVLNWKKQMPEDWRAARDFLARRFPDRWGPKDKHEHTGPGGGPVVVNIVENVVGAESHHQNGQPAPGAGRLPA